MSDHVISLMEKAESYEKKAEILFEYLKLINKQEYDFFDIEYLTMNRQQRQKFIDDIINEKTIYVHQAPFFGNTTEEEFKTILKLHPEWCTPYKFVGIEKPIVAGDIYFMRLKHESSNKMSMRSSASLNVKNLPSKSTLKKEKKIQYSQTPIRLGEMEVSNLMIAKRPDIVEKLLKTYSTNEELREQTIIQLLSPGKTEDGHIRNTLNMNIDVDLKSNRSVSREILDKQLNVLGYSLIDNDDKGSDND